MDYEYYDATQREMTEDEIFEERCLLAILENYEEQEATCLIMPSNDFTEACNLYFGEDPADGVFRWQLHYPECE